MWNQPKERQWNCKIELTKVVMISPCKANQLIKKGKIWRIELWMIYLYRRLCSTEVYFSKPERRYGGFSFKEEAIIDTLGLDVYERDGVMKKSKQYMWSQITTVLANAKFVYDKWCFISMRISV